MSEVAHIGFTGTRLGVSHRQGYTLRTVLAEMKNQFGGEMWFHHGDCVGGDFDAHVTAKALGFKIHVHPPEDEKFRANVTDYDSSDWPLPYLKRNQVIVDRCDILIACPYQISAITLRPTRSGTWSTVRKAERKGIPRIIVFADGVIVRE